MRKKKSDLELILEQGWKIISKTKKGNLYFLQKNFVEIVYDKKTERIIEVYKLR